MKVLNNSVQNFKGYDAVPLKKLHIASSWGKIKDELVEIAKKENFSIQDSMYNCTFNQDTKVILEKENKPFLIAQEHKDIMQKHLPSIMLQYQMNAQMVDINENSGFISGGNFFIGKYPNNEKWMLVGSNEKAFNDNSEKISQLYGIKKENIFYVQQQDYHLDLSIRPIGYPYVLVNNPKMALEYRNKALGIKQINKHELDRIAPKMEQYKKCMQQLEQAGFKPIPIGGVFEGGINFINAVVNLHEDKTISYITNSSKSNTRITSKYQEVFEKELRKKLEQLNKDNPDALKLANVYFVQGESHKEYNEVMENLIAGAGGIHCMCLEEPNFEAWA